MRVAAFLNHPKHDLFMTDLALIVFLYYTAVWALVSTLIIHVTRHLGFSSLALGWLLVPTFLHIEAYSISVFYNFRILAFLYFSIFVFLYFHIFTSVFIGLIALLLHISYYDNNPFISYT